MSSTGSLIPLRKLGIQARSLIQWICIVTDGRTVITRISKANPFSDFQTLSIMFLMFNKKLTIIFTLPGHVPRDLS